MHSRTIVLAVGLLAAPLSLVVSPSPASLPAGGVALAAATSPDATVDGRVLSPAPVVEPEGVSPVDRAAQPGSRTLDAGPTNSTPFSSTPSGTLSGGGDQTSQRDRTTAPSDASGITPNLGR